MLLYYDVATISRLLENIETSCGVRLTALMFSNHELLICVGNSKKRKRTLSPRQTFSPFRNVKGSESSLGTNVSTGPNPVRVCLFVCLGVYSVPYSRAAPN